MQKPNFAAIMLALKNYRLYRDYKKRLAGRKIIDLTRSCGYFFTVGLLYYDPREKPHEIPMQSGKTAICKLLDYKCYSDPYDMIEWAKYQFLGYVGQKLISECTFAEYLTIYCSK